MLSVACVELKGDVPRGAAVDDGDDGGAPAGRDAGDPEGDVPHEGGVADADGAPRSTGAPSIALVPAQRADADFIVTPDNVIVDSATGLRWRKASTSVFWEEGKKLCADARSEGASDWRLPTRIELLSVADYASSWTTALPAAFGTSRSRFWSSEEVLRIVPVHPVWVVDFQIDPSVFTRPPDAREGGFQRCVRGPELRRAALVREGNLVRDTISGRLWERTRSWDTMTVQEGADRCSALIVDGQKGFRLPRVKELFSLLDVALPAPPFDDEVFPEPRGGQVMTATPNRGLSRNGVRPPVLVDFDTGRLDAAASAYVRCVR